MKFFILSCYHIYFSEASKVSDDKLFGLFTYDTIFTVFITLFVFITGILLDRFLKHLDKLKKQKELRNYFKHYLDKITDKTCTQLIEMYNYVYQNNGINEGVPTAPPKILTSDFSRIKKMEDKDLYGAFEDKESLSKLLSNIDFIELMINEINTFHKRIRLESDALRKPLQEKINRYFDALANYIENIRKNDPQYEHRDEFKKLVNDSIIMFHSSQGQKRALKEVYKEIIRPIQRSVVTTNIFRNDPLGFQIAELGKDISVQYNYVKLLTIEFRLSYRRLSGHVKKAQKDLSEARGKINWC